jgi:hypothetical protein
MCASLGSALGFQLLEPVEDDGQGRLHVAGEALEAVDEPRHRRGGFLAQGLPPEEWDVCCNRVPGFG